MRKANAKALISFAVTKAKVGFLMTRLLFYDLFVVWLFCLN